QEVFISKDKTKWNKFKCTLAEPRVVCRDDGSCSVENGLEFLTAEDQDNGFWIGYAKKWISFAYVGCGTLDAGNNYSVSTLGECRRITGCKTFGIQNSTAGLRCKCASNNAPRTKTCGEKCEEADQYPCGGTADTDTFSLYTVENVPPSDHSNNKTRNCLLFYYQYKTNDDYYWESCNLNFTPALLCSNKKNSESNPMAEKFNSSNERWAKAVENCIDGGKFPASIQSINNVKFTDEDKQNHWTGIIKKESIISLSDMLGSTAGLAAGLSVSVVVIIIVAVIVMVFLKRRGLLTKCFKQNDEKSIHTEDTATEIACISTPIFESTTNIVDDLTATNHSYFVLEKTFDEETKEETEHYAEPDMTDVDHHDLTDESQKDTENDYDTTNDKKSSVKAGLAKPNNSYNKVTLHQTSEYDHINRRPPKSDRQTENEYDISNNLIDGKPNNNLNEN
ncbi:hypothetical protein MAR_014404, partial [Mya arenaria]